MMNGWLWFGINEVLNMVYLYLVMVQVVIGNVMEGKCEIGYPNFLYVSY